MEDNTNGIIHLMRGDTYAQPIIINIGNKLNPEYYSLQENDVLYFGLMQPNKTFEEAIIRKRYTHEDEKDINGNTILKLYPEDTLHLLVGKYYYMIKLKRQGSDEKDIVTTIVPPTQFFLDGGKNYDSSDDSIVQEPETVITIIDTEIEKHNTSDTAHNDIRTLINNLTSRLNSVADSDDETLDQLSEIVDYIKNNRSLIDEITKNKINVSDIIDNLTTDVSNKPLSAAQGVALKELIDAINVPTKTSELTNDSGFLTEHQSLDGYATESYVDDKVDENNLLVQDDSNGNVTFSSVSSTSVVVADIVQTTGDSTTAVMSQKATTTEINAIKSDLETLKDNGTSTGTVSEVSIFKGLTASFYGDSLTESNYHYTKGYHEWVKDLLGLTSYNNYGVSGYKISNVYSKVNSINDTADIIFVMCGVNDENFSTPLGEFGDSDTSTIYGSCDILCSALKEKYPTKLIVFITPHYQTKYPHSSGITSYEVSKAMKEVCEKYVIPVYDNFILSGIYETNLSYWTTDNCHWNDKAHEMLGRNLSKFMMNTFRYYYGYNEVEEIPVTLSSISATYSGGSVLVGTSVNDLTGIVVKANYSNGTNETVTGYTLSGTIAEGSNTVTITYSGKTTTITVIGYVEEESEITSYIGKTVTVNKNCTNHNYVHLTALIKVDNDVQIGSVISGSLYGVNGVNMTSITNHGGAVFADDSGKVSNGLFVAQLSEECDHVQTIENGNVSVTHEDLTMNKEITTNYVKVPFVISGTVPYSFEISDIQVCVNGVTKDIIALGTFFASNRESLTIS